MGSEGMMNSRSIGIFQKLVVLVAAVSIFLGSCSLSPPAQIRNQIAISVTSAPKTFNPALINSRPSVDIYTSEGLVGENAKGELEPALAESWKISGNDVSFKLRPNLKWSDGQQLTVDDVLFSFNEVYLNKDIPTDAQDGLRIGLEQKLPTLKKTDDRTVVFTTPEPFAPAVRTFGGTAILPAHKLRASVQAKDQSGKSKFLSTWGTDTPPQEIVSNGMYQISSYLPGERLVFKRNPYYWRKDAQGKQLPYIERLVWQVVENSDAALMQFRTKNTDSYGVSPAFFSLLKKEEKKGDFTIRNVGADSGISFMAFNLNKGSRKGDPLVDPYKSAWFNNVKFRQATAYALDRQRMINNIYRGLGATQNSSISVGTPYYRTPKKSEIYDYDLAKAKQLLQESGFKYKKNNQLFDSQNNRVRFTLLVPAGSATVTAIGTQIQQDLEKLGMDVNFSPLDFSILVDKINNRLDWDALVIGFTGGVEPNGGSNLWLSSGRSHMFNQKPSPQQEPLTGQEVSDWEKELDKLYINAARELDETKRKALYSQVQEVTQANVPTIFLVNPLYLSAMRNRVKGVVPSTTHSAGVLSNLAAMKVQD
jgi:peptide/nickel transport system substrate-binding protein